MKQALDSAGQAYTINEGDGAFYGPKIDFDVTDALGRKWQCATIQLDYQLPQRFNLKYIGADNAEHCPVVIHRAIFGSFERFIALLIEHYAGAFPLWLAPLQVLVLPIVDRHVDYARTVVSRLTAAGLRAELDERQEKIGYKIREAQLQKIPYMLVIGDREAADGTVAVRTRTGGDQGAQAVDAFVAAALEEVRARRADCAVGRTRRWRDERRVTYGYEGGTSVPPVSGDREGLVAIGGSANDPGRMLSLSTAGREANDVTTGFA